jgi:hypothetical protein
LDACSQFIEMGRLRFPGFPQPSVFPPLFSVFSLSIRVLAAADPGPLFCNKKALDRILKSA